MTYLESLILGFIQAATEFLPISSSGHLVIGQEILGVESSEITMEILLHLGTLLSIIYYYRFDLKDLIGNAVLKKNTAAGRYIVQLAGATIPAVIFGLLFKSHITGFFNNIQYVSIALLFTGGILFSTRKINSENNPITWSTVMLIGTAQAFAVIPGISRSGVTIAAALLCGVQHKEAAKFSFFLAIPVLFGAGVLELQNLANLANLNTGPVVLGFFSAFIGGILAIKVLLRIITQKKFWMFAIYCWGIGILTMGYTYI